MVNLRISVMFEVSGLRVSVRVLGWGVRFSI